MVYLKSVIIYCGGFWMSMYIYVYEVVYYDKFFLKIWDFVLEF